MAELVLQHAQGHLILVLERLFRRWGWGFRRLESIEVREDKDDVL